MNRQIRLLQRKARPNGNLGPAYIMGALKEHGVEVDYLDCTVGREGDDLNKTFYNREELENGNIRYGIDSKELYSIFADYNIIATSSILLFKQECILKLQKLQKKFQKIVEKNPSCFWRCQC